MTDLPAITGFRQDRVGARIVCLLNVIRLGQEFGVPARFIWLSDPSGPYPELVDPGHFLDAGFVARHIRIVPRGPDLASLRNLGALAPTMDCDLLAKMLARGDRFFCDTAFGALCMIDEGENEVRARLAAIAADLPLSPRLRDQLARLRDRLAQGGEGAAPMAIHVRRGDILDGDPWSLSSWSEKYVPDEFFRAWIDRQPGPVVAFSDTPAAVHHLAQGDPRVMLIDDLLRDQDLLPAERDVLELLVMGDFARIGAPSNSAFSRAAQLVGRARVEPLPMALPRPTLVAAYDALLDRVIDRPDSFFAMGDLAQSLHYAGAHALTTGQGARLARARAQDQALMTAHPFTRLVLAQAALAGGMRELAKDLLAAALEDGRTRRRDRLQCEQMLTLIESEQSDFDIDEALIEHIFIGRSLGSELVVPIFAARALLADGRAGKALMFPPELAIGLVRGTGDGDDPAIAALGGGTRTRVLPGWLYLMDWAELLPDEISREPLRRYPPLAAKLRIIGPDAAEVEARLEAGEKPPPPETEKQAWRIGLYGAALAAHGRYRRAMQVQSWLHEHRPNDPLTWKRIADIHFAHGNAHRGMTHLDQALALMRSNPLLQLSKARRMAAVGRRRGAIFHLGRAEGFWPGLNLWVQQRILIQRALRLAAQQAAPQNAEASAPKESPSAG
ncbi:MAG: hypothetical protein Q4G22_06525 [Paracoccus sp. (in: a-proteobacteria)]|uniref:tetratricopeptide repeat protein n=1 Tax=Paracoccus sp. TaxID=267 RepID=UPI0026DF35AE|nr:hypothetical protein [Paracoccus sp. (in: a-proteobacteria)]MDO5631475.1 hypothetical protein [Paracoccus sp. (in: a-proteobacteria)]